MIQEINYQPFSKNPLKSKITEGISIFTVCKNRETYLEQALSTWVLLKEVDEIIIIDWSSDNSLIPLIEKYQNGKIILAIVPEQEKFNLSCSYNLAARLTSNTKIFKVDSDILISIDFFSKHILTQGEFISGNWEIARNENEKHLNGNVYLYREDFFKVNGFNEYLRTYGWDDSDLFERLQSIGLQKKDMDNDTLLHIAHGGRTQFIKKIDKIRNINDKDLALFHIRMNIHISKLLPIWTKENKMSDFLIEKGDNNTLTCILTGEDKNLLTDQLLIESEKLAVNDMLNRNGILIQPDVFKLVTHDEIFDLYNICLSNDATQTSLYLTALYSKYSDKNNGGFGNEHYTLGLEEKSPEELKKIIMEMSYELNKSKEKMKRNEEELTQKIELLNAIINSFSFKLRNTLIWPIKKLLKK